MKKFVVKVVYHGTHNFLVEAENSEEATEKANEEYANGENPALLGDEWEEIERVHTPEEI